MLHLYQGYLCPSRIARALTETGIAVVRFDFAGLGHFDGQFANTNFSSNVEDLVAAANHMRDALAAPHLIIGHSLGGTAILAAAGQIDEVKALVTIGAPAEPAHLAHMFQDSAEEIETTGEANVLLAGREFTIKKQFLDNIQRQTLTECLAKLGRALLVMHSLIDITVGIENAAAIFAAAKHPKSFISLDNTDHLVSKKGDAEYAATVLASWASRYIPAHKTSDEAGTPAGEGEVVVAETGEKPFAQTITAGVHNLRADEPLKVGGENTGPTPYDLLLSGLGACTSMTIRMYENFKKWPLERAVVRLKHDKIHA